MKIAVFCHSLVSDWNHGNAHFLRGIVTELIGRGHDTAVYEPQDAWSVRNLYEEYGGDPVRHFHLAYPRLQSRPYRFDNFALEQALDNADLVLVHEWNEPALVERIGAHHRRSRRPYLLLFHDTHHRSITAPGEMQRYRLDDYDGVLAFGASIAEQYRRHGWGRQVRVWHEAADTRVFRPLENQAKTGDLVWIGNWGDDERTAELSEFVIEPVRTLGLRARMYGVRYPHDALNALFSAGIEYCGWLANFRVPEVFAQYRFTVHVPRQPYARALAGVPTIRMFEALACGVPLLSAPWDDSEGLFRPGEDFVFVRNGQEMRREMRRLLDDPEWALTIARNGRETIEKRHTCAHRVDELMSICEELGAPAMLASRQT